MIKTLTIDKETTVDLNRDKNNTYFSENQKFCRIDNKSDGSIYASLSPNIVAGEEGVLEIVNGTSGILELSATNKIYVLGNGKIQIQTSSAPFDITIAGGSGGSGQNAIERIQVNGNTLPIAADKSVDIPVPTKNSQLQNDSDFATKTYVGEQIANIDKLSRSIVEELPTDEEAEENVIYMIMVADISGDDKYQEYLKIDGTLQMIGDTSVDLSDYVKNSDLNAQVETLNQSIDQKADKTALTALETDVNSELDTKVDIDISKSEQKSNAKLAVQIAHPNNYLIYDDLDKPSTMVAIPKFYLDEVIDGAEHIVHPAFLVNGAEQNAIYISKYQNIVENGRVYSLPMKDPAVNINFDRSWTCCKNKGSGWHLMTAAEWAAIALWCKKNGTIPKGNNNYGKDITEIALPQKAIPASIGSDGKINRVLTGSGRESWYHDGTYAGIADLNGNVWEWIGDMRLVYGELQVIPFNNAATGEADVSVTSTDWKAINANATSYDDLFITPDGSGTTTDSVKLDWVTDHWQWQSATIVTSSVNYHRCLFANITYNGISDFCHHYIQALALLPEKEVTADNYGEVSFYAINGKSEICAIRGGNWNYDVSAGIFHLGFDYPRSDLSPAIGARSAYINTSAQPLVNTLDISDDLQMNDRTFNSVEDNYNSQNY